MEARRIFDRESLNVLEKIVNRNLDFKDVARAVQICIF